MIINGHTHCNSSQKMEKCHQDYIHALEKERCKILVFQRELPLSLQLLTQAIETCKQQLSETTSHEYNSNECSEDMPVLEEKQSLKKTKTNEPKKECKVNGNGTKSDWLSSVQLWNNQTPDPPSSSKQDSPRKVVVKKIGNGGAFHPFKKIDKTGERTVFAASASSTGETGSDKEEEKCHSQRKSRRCWSAELHKRFLHALEQLGGSHAATPKQIRELMKVDGLTNDEVKSHLQKYRLHTRRPSPFIHNTNNSNSQAPQFLVVRGIWVPPEYAAPITSTVPSAMARSNAPIATLPPPQLNDSSNSDYRGSHSDEGHVQSHSPPTSSSEHD